jgi:HEAT repeat protein
VELIQLVRGDERERFAARATRLRVPDQLRRQLKRGNARERQRAAEALGQFVDAKTISSLRAALDDPNPDVRLTAAISLAEKGEAPPASELVERLGIGREERSLLVASLFKEIARHRSGDLELLLRDERTPRDARVAAVEALAGSGRYELVPLIAQVVLDTPPGDRVLPRYLHALAEFGHPAAEAAVARCLESPRPQVRGAAAAAAGRIGLASLASRLEALLEDPSWGVRFSAGRALARLGEEGRARLVERARERSTLSGTAAALILAEGQS